uniref:Uncharacterized protein n=1 Tax=Lepeophtheirus salmonis TaxID=72036 RepID=A0A0K2VFS2_LEPSM
MVYNFALRYIVSFYLEIRDRICVKLKFNHCNLVIIRKSYIIVVEVTKLFRVIRRISTLEDLENRR